MLKFEPTASLYSLAVIRVHSDPKKGEEFIGHLLWNREAPPRFVAAGSFPYVTIDEMRMILSQYYETKSHE